MDPVVFFKLQLVMFFEDIRLWRVNAEAMVIATGQNIKRLLTFSGRGPRKLAQVEALRTPAPTSWAKG